MLVYVSFHGHVDFAKVHCPASQIPDAVHR